MHSGDQVLFSDTLKCVEVFFSKKKYHTDTEKNKKYHNDTLIKSSTHFKVPDLHCELSSSVTFLTGYNSINYALLLKKISLYVIM